MEISNLWCHRSLMVPDKETFRPIPQILGQDVMFSFPEWQPRRLLCSDDFVQEANDVRTRHARALDAQQQVR